MWAGEHMPSDRTGQDVLRCQQYSTLCWKRNDPVRTKDTAGLIPLITEPLFDSSAATTAVCASGVKVSTLVGGREAGLSRVVSLAEMSLLHMLSTSGSVEGCVNGERLTCGPPYGLSGWRQGRSPGWCGRRMPARRSPDIGRPLLWRPAAPPLGAIQRWALWHSSALAIGRPAALAKVWTLVGGCLIGMKENGA